MSGIGISGTLVPMDTGVPASTHQVFEILIKKASLFFDPHPKAVRKIQTVMIMVTNLTIVLLTFIRNLSGL